MMTTVSRTDLICVMSFWMSLLKNWIFMERSLEVLIALSRRVAFTAGGEPDDWAWRLLKNLRLTKSSDPLSEARLRNVDDILDAVIWRTYEPNGQGGFFPLKNPQENQRKIEIWYQMNKYVIEKEGP